MSVADDLRLAASLFEDRNREYGEAYKIVGDVLEKMFPNGIALNTKEDHVRYHLLGWAVGKLVRYSANFNNGGHDDSIKDAGVYCAILRNFDEETNKKN